MFDSLIRLIAWTQKDSYSSLEQALSITLDNWVETLKERGIFDYVILSTCNRLEIYYASQEEITGYPLEETSMKASGVEALRHLFNVSAGLESMSVGENEILHQVKEAFDTSVKDGHVHDNLALIFRRAISTGKLVRKETGISKGKVSIPALSIDLLSRKYRVEGRKILVVGTGKMAADLLKYIQKANPGKITILGRSGEKAQLMAQQFSADSASIALLGDRIADSDIIVTATSSKSIVVSRDMLEGMAGRKVFLDISNPKNVEEPMDGDNYDLIDLSTLNPILERNIAGKENEIEAAASIVRKQVEQISMRLSGLETEQLIGMLYKHADELKSHEISRFKKALAAGADFDEALEAMSTALVNKLLASQTEVLRNVHGNRLTGDIQSAIKNTYSTESAKTSSKKPQDHQDSQSQQDQTPRLSQKP